jgi:hypothetical protein
MNRYTSKESIAHFIINWPGATEMPILEVSVLHSNGMEGTAHARKEEYEGPARTGPIVV